MNVFGPKYLAAFEQGSGDVTIVTADGAKIQAHSLVLELSSPVLQATLKGPMREAQTKSLNFACDEATAYLFLKFLYMGTLTDDILSPLEQLASFMKMADYYGISEEFAKAFDIEALQAPLHKLLDSIVPHMSVEDTVRLLQHFAYLGDVNGKLLLEQILKRVKVTLGLDAFRWLCHKRACDACVFHSKLLCIGQVGAPSEWIRKEINRESVVTILQTYPKNPQLPLMALSDFIELVNKRIASEAQSRRPEVGKTLRVNGTVCMLLEDDRSNLPYRVQFPDGETFWVQEFDGNHNYGLDVWRSIPEAIRLIHDITLTDEPVAKKPKLE